MHRFGRVHRKRHARRENAAHHRQHQPFLQIEILGGDAHFALFQLARAGDNPHADHRYQHAEQRHSSATGVDQHVKITVQNRRHQGADNQGDPDGNPNPHRHSQIAHRQAVVDITDAPHRAKQKYGQQRGGAKGREISPEIREE
ncbi:hypothetical protein D3C78_1364330 [compost metagenome]